MAQGYGSHSQLQMTALEEGSLGTLSPLSVALFRSYSRGSNAAVPEMVGNGGAFLAWKDIKVTIPAGSGGTEQTVLHGLTGYAEPGSIMAIMGPSGSGKSTLLDTLAGRLSKNARLSGDIFLNGKKTRLSYGASAYVTQEDTLVGTLSVLETIMFSANLRLPDSMPRAEKMALVKSTIQEMGLQDAADTAIGNWHLRGLSGGEKRRVSIALEILTRPRLLFLDEPTSGLDSASAFFVVTTLKNLARDGRTVIASIHQPSSEVFELFDNLFLLSGGQTVYFGAAAAAHQHFADAGIPCPARRNPSDHFLRAINSDFDRVTATIRGSFKLRKNDIEHADPMSKMSTAQRMEILVDAYQASDFAMTAAAKVHEISHMNGSLLESKGSQASSFMQALTLTRRSFLNMSRDMGYYWLRLAIYIVLSLCIGTLYYKVGLDESSIQARAAGMSFIAGFLTFMAIGGFPSFVEDMKVFSRERLNGHYGVAVFVIGNSLSSIPFLFLISLASGAIVYFMVQLHPGFGHFSYFVIALFACMLVVEGMMMAVASIVPNFLMGIITGAGIQGIYLLVAGFFRLPNDMPKPFWRYPMSYIGFHMYALQGMYQNDFLGLSFKPKDGTSPYIKGEDVLRDSYQLTLSRDKWENLAILFTNAVLYRVVFFLMIKASEQLGPALHSVIASLIKTKAAPPAPRQSTISPENGNVASHSH